MQSIQALMSRFTIRTRMNGAIAIVLTLFALVGGTGLLAVLHLRSLNAEFMEHSLHEFYQVTELRTDLGRLVLHEKNMVIDYEDKLKVLAHQEAWRASLKSLQGHFEALLQGEEDEDNPIARASITELAAYAGATKRVVDQIQDSAYDTIQAADKMMGRSKQHLATVTTNVDKIEQIVRHEAQATRDSFESAMRNTLLAFAGTLAFAFVVVVPSTLINARTIVQPIRQARDAARAITEGDLTHRVPTGGRDEAGDLLAAIARMQERLRELVGQLRGSAAAIETSSVEVAAGNQDLSQRTEQTASDLQQTASSMEQFTGTVRQSADSAAQAKQLATSAADAAQRGGTVMHEVVASMQDISAGSRRIADIIGVIDGIAFQTNILALNAAVEAARAGEQGRGFAVVAGEVRSLAQRSAEAAREIKDLIGASVDKVESGSKLVRDAGTTMEEIVASVRRVTDIVSEISTAAADQSGGIAQVNGAVASLDQMTQQNAALVEQSAAAAESLKEQAQRLAALVSAFRVDTAATGHAAPPRHLANLPTLTAAIKPAAAPRPAEPATLARQTIARARQSAAPSAALPARPADDAGGDWETF